MQMLTPEIFTEALTLCSEYVNYRTGIIFDNRNTMKEFIDTLRSIGHIPNVRRAITRRADYGRLEFFNGSIIEIILGTEDTLRGRRYNQIITSGVFDEDLYKQIGCMSLLYQDVVPINEKIFNTALFGMRARQHTKWVSSDAEERLSTEQTNEASQELEAFLDSFAIKKCE